MHTTPTKATPTNPNSRRIEYGTRHQTKQLPSRIVGKPAHDLLGIEVVPGEKNYTLGPHRKDKGGKIWLPRLCIGGRWTDREAGKKSHLTSGV
jgi:hypothetical protein